MFDKMSSLWPDNPVTHLSKQRRWVVMAQFNRLFCSDLSSGRTVSQGVASKRSFSRSSSTPDTNQQSHLHPRSERQRRLQTEMSLHFSY